MLLWKEIYIIGNKEHPKKMEFLKAIKIATTILTLFILLSSCTSTTPSPDKSANEDSSITLPAGVDNDPQKYDTPDILYANGTLWLGDGFDRNLETLPLPLSSLIELGTIKQTIPRTQWPTEQYVMNHPGNIGCKVYANSVVSPDILFVIGENTYVSYSMPTARPSTIQYNGNSYYSINRAATFESSSLTLIGTILGDVPMYVSPLSDLYGNRDFANCEIYASQDSDDEIYLLYKSQYLIFRKN
jgi:hypothetical protein